MAHLWICSAQKSCTSWQMDFFKNTIADNFWLMVIAFLTPRLISDHWKSGGKSPSNRFVWGGIHQGDFLWPASLSRDCIICTQAWHFAVVDQGDQCQCTNCREWCFILLRTKIILELSKTKEFLEDQQTRKNKLSFTSDYLQNENCNWCNNLLSQIQLVFFVLRQSVEEKITQSEKVIKHPEAFFLFPVSNRPLLGASLNI